MFSIIENEFNRTDNTILMYIHCFDQNRNVHFDTNKISNQWMNSIFVSMTCWALTVFFLVLIFISPSDLVHNNDVWIWMKWLNIYCSAVHSSERKTIDIVGFRLIGVFISIEFVMFFCSMSMPWVSISLCVMSFAVVLCIQNCIDCYLPFEIDCVTSLCLSPRITFNHECDRLFVTHTSLIFSRRRTTTQRIE